MPAILVTLRRAASRLGSHWLLAAALALPVVSGFAAEADDLARLKERVLQLRDQSRWPEALPLAGELVTATIRQHGEVSADTADALHHWAYLVQENGDYDRAEELWQRALAIDEQMFGKDTVQTTRRLHLLANLYRDRGDYAKAAPLLQRALAIREKVYGPDDPETAQVVKSCGTLATRAGDYAEAEAKLLRALAIYEKAGARSNVAATHSALGWLYLEMGDLERAEQSMWRSMALRRRILGRNHESVAFSLSELAMIRRGQHAFADAESLFRESLVIREKLLGTNHISVAAAWLDLGATHLAGGRLELAGPALQRSLDIFEGHLGANHPRVAAVLMELGRLEEVRGEYAAAKRRCEQALRIRESSFGPAHRSTLASLRQVAWLDVALGRPERALVAADQLQTGEEALLANVLSFTSERQRLVSQRESSLFRQRYDLWAHLGAPQPLARAILRTKGLVLDSLLEDRLLAEASHDPEVVALLEQLARARRAQARSTAAAPASDSEQASRARQIESTEAALARRVAGLGRARRALSTQVEEIRTALPDHALLLELVRYRHYVGRGAWQERYGALLLARNGDPRWVPLGPADAIDRAVKRYQHGVRSPEAPAALVPLLRELHARLWVPLEAALPAGTRQIVVSPDGELNFVSFATLLTPADRFLGEEFSFGYVSCGRDLLFDDRSAPVPAPANGQLLVWANPDFGAPAGHVLAGAPAARHRGLRGLNFRPLPGAEQEGRMLCERARQLGFDGAVLRLGTEATERELHHLRAPKALHLATHGFVLPPFGTEDWPEFGNDSGPGPRTNPMQRSGLALAGARRTLEDWARGKATAADEDGIVTAEEIGRLDLRGTWLVALSACDTGAGEAQTGEGVLGLRRGFIQAGARNLLLTLWPIDDVQTVGLMPEFYAAARASGSPVRALAQVQRNWLQQLRAGKGIAEACRLAGPFILSFQGQLR